MLSADETIDKIQKSLNGLKTVFLRHDYDDQAHGWIVEDRINEIQDYINDYTNREFKHTEADPFA